MTSANSINGTARCAEAYWLAAIETDLVINFESDAPLTPEWFVEGLITSMIVDNATRVANPVVQCVSKTYNHFIEDRKSGRSGGTTVVFNHDFHAVYFSKKVVPYADAAKVSDKTLPVFHHIGVHAYRPAALLAYISWTIGSLEELEGLEQLRFLKNGQAVRCVVIEGRWRVSWDFINPEDIERIETELKEVKL